METTTKEITIVVSGAPELDTEGAAALLDIIRAVLARASESTDEMPGTDPDVVAS